MWFRTWMWPLLAGCGTLTYYEKDLAPKTTTDEGDDDDNGDDDDDTTPGDDDDDDNTTPGDDDDDTTTPGDDDDDTTTIPEVCVYPTVPITAGTGAGNMATPSYVGMAFVGHVIGNDVYDYSVDGVDYSSILVFDFFDANVNFMCNIIYDASGAIPAAGWSTDSGANLWAAFDVPVSGGSSNCGAVNAGIYTDMRDWIEDRTWGFGLGNMIGIEADLAAAINASGGNWAADWAPYTYSLYATGGPFAGSGQATEVSWAQTLESSCEDVLVDAQGYGTPLSPPGGGPLEAFVNSGSWMVYLIE